MDPVVSIGLALFGASLIMLVGACVLFSMSRRKARRAQAEDADGPASEQASTPDREGGEGAAMKIAASRRPMAGEPAADTPEWDPVYHGSNLMPPANPTAESTGLSPGSADLLSMTSPAFASTPRVAGRRPETDDDEPTYELATNVRPREMGGLDTTPEYLSPAAQQQLSADDTRGLQLPDDHPQVRISWVDAEAATLPPVTAATASPPLELAEAVQAAMVIQRWIKRWQARRVFAQRQAAISSHFNSAASLDAAHGDAIARLAANEAFPGGLFELTNSSFFAHCGSRGQKDAQFKQIGEGLGRSNHVTKVKLVNVAGTDVLAEAIADALRQNTRITEINLESNEIGGEGVAALAAVIARSKSIVKIRLANQLRPIPTTALIDLVSAVEINGVTTTCSVDLRDRVMQLGLDAALERNGDKVRVARVAKEERTGKRREMLSPLQTRLLALETSGETTLDLSDDVSFKGLSDSWKTTRFCECVAKSSTLTVLKLSGLSLKDSFATTFATVALAGRAPLQEIDLSRNSISATGVIAMANALGPTNVCKVKMNNQSAGCSTAAELAVVEAARTCRSLTVFSIPWRNKQNQDAFDRATRENADLVRAAKAAARGITYTSASASPILNRTPKRDLPPGVPQGAVAVLF